MFDTQYVFVLLHVWRQQFLGASDHVPVQFHQNVQVKVARAQKKVSESMRLSPQTHLTALIDFLDKGDISTRVVVERSDITAPGVLSCATSQQRAC